MSGDDREPPPLFAEDENAENDDDGDLFTSTSEVNVFKALKIHFQL